MNFRGGMNEMMRQAARLQRKIEQAKTDAKDKELVASEGIDLVLDGVCAAVNSGLEQADKAMEAEIEKATGGVKIPGLT